MSVEDFLAGARVQVAGRFVGEQDRRIDRQRAGDRDALAFAAGQLFWQVLHTVVKPERGSSSSRARASTLRRGQPRRCSGRPTFSKHVKRRQQVEELKNEPDLVAPHAA